MPIKEIKHLNTPEEQAAWIRRVEEQGRELTPLEQRIKAQLIAQGLLSNQTQNHVDDLATYDREINRDYFDEADAWL